MTHSRSARALIFGLVGLAASAWSGCSNSDPVSPPDPTASSSVSGARAHFCTGACSGARHVGASGNPAVYRPGVGWIELP